MLTMAESSNNRWNKPIIWIAILGLLWSQFALAVHAIDCEPANAAKAASSQTKCHDGDDSHVDATCENHCGADYSADSKRLPPLDSQSPQHAFAWLTLTQLPVMRAQRLPLPLDFRYWHGPTGHPAAVLLI